MSIKQACNGGYEPTEVEQRAALINDEQESYQALINTISGGKHILFAGEGHSVRKNAGV